MNSEAPSVEIPTDVVRALMRLDDGSPGGAKGAAEACGVARSTLNRWRKRRDKDPAVRQAFQAALSDIRTEQRRERAAKVIDHLARGGGMFELAEVLGVARSTVYLDLKEVGGVERMRELRETLALASDIQGFALKAQAQAALVESLPRLLELVFNGKESATVRAAVMGAIQKLAADQPTGAKAPAAVSVTNNVVATARTATMEGVTAPCVDVDALDDEDLHQLADALVAVVGSSA